MERPARRILESGHYYAAKGPTVWSRRGWEIMEGMRQGDDETMLFVDDIHPIWNVSAAEAEMETIQFKPDYTHLVFESKVEHEAREILERLKHLSKKNRARWSGNGKWYVGDFAVTDEYGHPTCVLLDAGLTALKVALGFRYGVNILPHYYCSEQTNLKRLAKRVLPHFDLKVVLFDLEGNVTEI